MGKYIVVVTVLFSVFSLASVGIVTQHGGSAYIMRHAKKISVRNHLKIEKKDILYTSANAWVKLRFDDNTIINAGKNATLVIEDYLSNGTSNSKASFGFLKGVFRSITGSIGKKAKKNFKVHLPNATIGIRGTEFYVDVSKKANKVLCTRGAITVSSAYGEVVVEAGDMLTLGREGQLGKSTGINKKLKKSLKRSLGVGAGGVTKKEKKLLSRSRGGVAGSVKNGSSTKAGSTENSDEDDTLMKYNSPIIDHATPDAPTRLPCPVPTT